MDLFNLHFTEKFYENVLHDEINLGGNDFGFFIVAYKSGDYVYLRDEHNVHYAYAKNGWIIKIPNFYCEDLPIGKHNILDETYIRVETQQEIYSKIEKYLAPYILHHVWGDDIFMN